MNAEDVVAALPTLIKEVEEHKGKKLTSAQIGDLLMEIGQAIKEEKLSASSKTLRVSPHWGACTCPTIVSDNPNTGRIDPMLCLCPSCDD